MCLTLATGTLLFFLLVVLPFTPKFTIRTHCHNTRHMDDCMSWSGMIVLSLVHVVPFAMHAFEMVFVEHKFAFENIKVELAALSLYVVTFLIWSVLCYKYLHASPYYVQDMVGEAISIVIYVLCLGYFVGVFFGVRWVHHRIWPPVTKMHYTDQLMSDAEEHFSSVPAAADFEVQTFTSDMVNKTVNGMGLVSPTPQFDTKVGLGGADEPSPAARGNSFGTRREFRTGSLSPVG
eukprot:CAMPEP_0170168778 /NCGR_PEP_ID=MMETSP0040_2-20121228/1736_1 /TAXON_ID=641309 /ORGANISM="Lotharella oceanica, Strain CCMP622" /LENGTH=233 /DNA_ID=CAMNT_0010407147 /DNA_START=269 /DNA_END=970 /DNA_ORIENTATION=-